MTDKFADSKVVIDVRSLIKYFPVKMGFWGAVRGEQKFVHAVDDISFKVREGEIIGFVGESGCGKTTTGRLITRLETPTSGGVYFHRDEANVKALDEIEDICAKPEITQDDKKRLAQLGKEIDITYGSSFMAKALKKAEKVGENTEAKAFLEEVRMAYSITKLEGRDLKAFRRNVQMIFQDPYESLNPRFTVYHTVAEPLIVHKIGETLDEREELVSRALENAELRPASEYLYRYPHELSGGQRQRVSIARALVIEPKFIVADEPVSMLDVSIRAGVMNLMLNLRDKFKIPYMFITHDVAVARYMSDRIGVMYLGKIVELGDSDEVVFNPQQPYTRALLSAVPVPDPTTKHGRISIKGELPSPINLPKGCRFHPRCLYAKTGICDKTEPKMKEVSPGHFVYCHFAGELPEESPFQETTEQTVESGKLASG
jgi:peptide/nickel transport system ATP-binding protein